MSSSARSNAPLLRAEPTRQSTYRPGYQKLNAFPRVKQSSSYNEIISAFLKISRDQKAPAVPSRQLPPRGFSSWACAATKKPEGTMKACHRLDDYPITECHSQPPRAFRRKASPNGAKPCFHINWAVRKRSHNRHDRANCARHLPRSLHTGDRWPCS